MTLLFLHNPRCSKSRQGLELITKKGLNFEVIEYIKNPLSKKQLGDLFSLLNKDYELNNFTRTKEKEFKADPKKLNKASWVSLIQENPKFLERPILFNTKKAIVGRPPEMLLNF